jgi:beta-glucosidase
MAPVALTRYPATSRPQDVQAARRATHGVRGRDPFNNSWWIDPIVFGRYPEEGLALFGADAPDVGADDFAIIGQPTDFLGINVYQGTPVRAADNADGFEDVAHPPGYPHTAFDWPITPQAMRFSAKFLHERYQLPLVITENGLSCRDAVSVDGVVHDVTRIDFTRSYLCALRQAIQEGADVRGYFHWSILDNFEWAAGYRERFGLIHVDFDTFERTPKRSAHWYGQVCRTNGRTLDAIATRQFLAGAVPA